MSMCNNNPVGSTVLLRVENVAESLGISKRTVWRLVSSGQLPRPVSIGRCRRWVPTDLERFVSGLRAK